MTPLNTSYDPLVARLSMLLSRLDPREGEACHVPGCIHEPGHVHRDDLRPLAA
jgi:hypothetical protein